MSFCSCVRVARQKSDGFVAATRKEVTGIAVIKSFPHIGKQFLSYDIGQCG